MFTLFLILLLFILFVLSTLCSNEYMSNNYNAFLNNDTTLLIRNNVYSQDELIEITKLSTCTKDIIVDYGININTINNNNISINQIINEPLIHTIEVDNKNYNLIQIEWRKTNFMFNGKQVGLTLHLIHNNYKTSENLNIIIPLDLISNYDEIETFININYKKMDDFFTLGSPQVIDKVNIITNYNDQINENLKILKNKFKLLTNYKRNYDIKVYNIDSLLSDKNVIPQYECCKNTIGPITKINLCKLKTIIESKKIYHIINEENGNNNLIVEPNIFNEEIGIIIMTLINTDPNLLYIKN